MKIKFTSLILSLLLTSLGLGAWHAFAKFSLLQDQHKERCLCLPLLDLERVKMHLPEGIFRSETREHLRLQSTEGWLQFQGPNIHSLEEKLLDASQFCGCHLGKKPNQPWIWHVLSTQPSPFPERESYWNRRNQDLVWMPWVWVSCLVLALAFWGLGFFFPKS